MKKLDPAPGSGSGMTFLRRGDPGSQSGAGGERKIKFHTKAKESSVPGSWYQLKFHKRLCEENVKAMKDKNHLGELREYTGVLIEEAKPQNCCIRSRIILQGTDEQEYPINEGQTYRFMEGRNLNRFLRRRVQIIGRLHQAEGKKSLDILHIKYLEIEGPHL